MPRDYALHETRNIGIMLTSMPVKQQQQNVFFTTLV